MTSQIGCVSCDDGGVWRNFEEEGRATAPNPRFSHLPSSPLLSFSRERWFLFVELFI